MGVKTPQKKPASQDWHPADIKAALEKCGWSLRRLSTANGLAADTLKHVVSIPWPRGERIVANTLGLRPEHIWPSRYDAQGKSTRRPAHRPRRELTTQPRTAPIQADRGQ